MKNFVKSLIRGAAHGLGFEIVRFQDTVLDASPEDRDIARRVAPYTVTSAHAVHALVNAIDYVVARGIPGSIVECGVGKGGSVMAAALKLRALQAGDREIYLFDTFAGMTEPGDEGASSAEASSMTRTSTKTPTSAATILCEDFPLEGLAQNETFLTLLREREIETIHTLEATLEDVFVDETGRTLR